MTWIDEQAELAKRGAAIAETPIKQVECFLKPTANRVIVQQDDIKRGSSVIYVPNDRSPRPTTGVVIAVPAHGDYDYLLHQKVLFAQFSGVALNFKSVNNWRVLQVEEIIAIFNNLDDQHELDTNVV